MAKIFYFLGHEQFQPEVLVEHGLLAEKAGFDGVCVSEHLNPWVSDVSAAGFAFSTLGALAVKTTELELLTGVVTPLFRYHPAIVAQAAATIDRLSNGRFSLGVGTGETLNETPLGIPFPSYPERAERMIEALAILTRLLSGEKVSFHGKYYQTENLKLYSPPLHNISLLLAAGGRKSATLATQHADGIIVSVKQIETALETVIKPAQENITSDKPFSITASRWSVYAKNDDEAWDALKPWRGLRSPNRDTIFDPEQLQRDADMLPREEVLGKYSMVKNANDYIATYGPLITELHADTIVIQTTAAKDQAGLIEMLGKQVLPNLKKL